MKKLKTYKYNLVSPSGDIVWWTKATSAYEAAYLFKAATRMEAPAGYRFVAYND